MTSRTPHFLHIDRRTLITNILLLFSGSAISQGLTALVLLLTARQIGPEQYGQYASSIVFTTFCAIFFNFGLDTWLLREGSAQPSQISNLAGSVLIIKIGFGGVWIAGMFILANHIPPTSFSVATLRLAALIVWMDSLLNTFQVLFKSVLRNQVSSGLIATSDFAWFLGTLMLLARGEVYATRFMELRILVLGATVIVAIIICWIAFAPKPQLFTLRQISKEFPPFFASDLLVLALLRADILIISLTIGEEAVGYYAPAVSLINAMYLIPNSFHGVMLPVLSNLFTRDVKRAWRLSLYLIFVQSVTGLILSLIVFLFSPLLVGFLGPLYSNSLEVLKILSLNLFFHGISFAMVSILIANNQQARRAFIQTIAVVVNVCLNLLVVHWAGIQGVAVVYVITEIALASGYTLLVFLLRKEPSLASV
jgi:O-antigen/teichoic acid export membrane protein